MLTPSAGSGGGAGGYLNAYYNYAPYSDYYYYSSSPGAGGAGGGFVDLTSGGNINIFGTIDAAGSRGGNGAAYYYVASAGGGGGSGGGIRCLTPNEINLTGGSLITAGGQGGSCGVPTAYFTGPSNHGGAGAPGRIVLEDADSLIQGLGTATVSPSEGAPGFYRGIFDAARFKGGGLTPQALTEVLFMGPTNPEYDPPVAADFPATPTGAAAGPGAAIPAGASRGLGKTGILIEARGYTIQPNGDPDPASQTAFYTVGYFADSGQEAAPTWVQSAFPGDIGPRPADNAGDGITNLDGRSFLQVRITFFLPTTVGPFDPGPYVNVWNLRFSSDQ
jgi:hypothetical protein